jgi:UDP-N-acetylmuramyl pentapeptide phosphotransferase/UDP-N-acetylglucosamine-1-phosphate transferase
MEGARVKIVNNSNICNVFDTSEGFADFAMSIVILGMGIVSAENNNAGISRIIIEIITSGALFK